MNRSTLRTAALTAATAVILAVPTAVWATHRFTDVPDGRFYTAATGWMADTGISKGCTTTTFCPNREMTRAEMAVFLHRASGTTSTPPSFNADKVDGKDASAFLGATAKARDADKLDGQDSSAVVRTTSLYTVGGDTITTDEGAGQFSGVILCDEGDVAVSMGYYEETDQYVYFTAVDEDYAVAQWSDDGAVAGTALLANLRCIDVNGDRVAATAGTGSRGATALDVPDARER